MKMIKIKLFFILLFLFFQSLAQAEEFPQASLLITTLQEPQVLSSREEILKLVQFASTADIKILFMQVYRANQSWFPSELADQSPYQACVKKVLQDPFEFLITESHKKGIKVFAWFNALSLSKNKDAPILKKYGIDILTRNVKEKKKLSDYKIDNQYFLEPGDMRVREDLLGIVEEIVDQYPTLDGILFDYIRYPDVNPSYGYTDANIARFKKAKGLKEIQEKSEAWKQWKRDQVTELLQVLAKRARSIRPEIGVAATGCVSYHRAYDESFQDWPAWINRGIVDFVTLMNYPIDVLEFKKYVAEAKEKVDDFKKLHIAVGAYKLLKLPDVFAQQFSSAMQAGGGGCVIFHYGSLLENPNLGHILFEDIKKK
jgi:uncharacterized lipoprotein YddW (UPF0748 family)